MVFECNGKKDKNGNEIRENTKYYGELESLFFGLMKRVSRKAVQERHSMEELLTAVIEYREMIKKVVSPLMVLE